jgi:molecular chaperone DnaK
MSKAVGIDLGTTNSVVSALVAGEAVVIPNAEGARTTPSVVAFGKAAQVLVGEVAKRQAVTNEDRTIRSVQRHMGTNWTVDIDGKKYTSQEISARMLMKLKRDAEAYLRDSVTQAVITVPAYFSDAQRTAIREAGKIAGLEVLRIISHSTAASLAYGIENEDEYQTILVFDLGGGTFDVSVLEIGDGVYEVKSTHGDTSLGGDDWDQRIINWLLRSFKEDHGVDLNKDKMAIQRLREAAEKAKIELSQVAQTQINLPFITATDAGPLHLDYTLPRAKFQELTADLIQRCKVAFDHAIKDAGLTTGEVDHVIMVGGSTRMPAVQELVRKLTGNEPHKGVNPDEVVAMGAAIQAGVLTGDVKDMLLMDVIPFSFGIGCGADFGEMLKLIERNTTLIARGCATLFPSDVTQTEMRIPVIQGEHERADFNELVATFYLVNLPHPSVGVLQVDVAFEIDFNSVLRVTAKNQATGAELLLLTEQEFDQRAQDIAERERVEWERAECERLDREELEKEKSDKARLERERLTREKSERERLEREKEQLAKDRVDFVQLGMTLGEVEQIMGGPGSLIEESVIDGEHGCMLRWANEGHQLRLRFLSDKLIVKRLE